MKGHRKRYGARLNNGGDNPSWSMSVLPYVLISQDSDVLQSAKVRDTLVFRTPTEKGQSDIYLFELEPGLEQVMKFNYTKASLPNRSRLALVGSCNGLLCLYDLDSMKSLYVVNPMTSEYVQTPPKLYKERRHAGTLVDAVHGFGFSPVTNQYKVIRVFEKVLSHPNVHHESLGEIFTLGTNKWRSIGKTPFPANKEFFGESWTSKEIVIARNSPKPDFRTSRPMMILKDGNVLILRDDETLELYDPTRKKFGNIAIKGVSSILEAVNYVASFDSLRDIVKGECVRDLYVK
uniref:F-box associated beta-propeller type 3 domain-containing protein n=1 Tax=Fagus sylvatica TaxID=28930 RepID=A0A2N9IR07_FAGSY